MFRVVRGGICVREGRFLAARRILRATRGYRNDKGNRAFCRG